MTSTTRSREWIRELAVAETRGPVAPLWSVCRSYMEWSRGPVLHAVLCVDSCGFCYRPHRASYAQKKKER